MSSFNFKRLVDKYSKHPVYQVSQTDGYYDYANGGIWVDGSITEIEFAGAVLQLTAKDLQYEENGAYSSEDRKLYCYNELQNNDKIKYKGLTYTILKKVDHSDYDSSLYKYFISRKEG